MKIVFEDNFIVLVDNERDHDFIGYVENKTDKDILIVFDDIDYEDIKIKTKDWVGLLANSTECEMFEMIKNNQFHIEYGEIE